jgi:hypothetical protein
VIVQNYLGCGCHTCLVRVVRRRAVPKREATTPPSQKFATVRCPGRAEPPSPLHCRITRAGQPSSPRPGPFPAPSPAPPSRLRNCWSRRRRPLADAADAQGRPRRRTATPLSPVRPRPATTLSRSVKPLAHSSGQVRRLPAGNFWPPVRPVRPGDCIAKLEFFTGCF